MVRSSLYVGRDVAEREVGVDTGALENGQRGREKREVGRCKDGQRRGEVRKGQELVVKEERNESSEDLPQPLSVADLQTYEDDLTSVTGVTTCTSYFTQLATDDVDSHTANERQPLHSTVAVPNSTWNPSIAATVEPHQGAAHLRLPSIREISRINAPSLMSITDSGVAASSDFNQPTGGSLTNIGGTGGGAITHTATTDQEHGEPPQNKQLEKTTSEIQNSKIGRRSRLAGGCMDSGLDASPDQDLRDGDDKGSPREVGGASTARQPLDKHSTPSGGTRVDLHFPAHSSTSITPSRYSTIRNRLGVPLAFTQKSVFANNRSLLRGNILPSQLKLTSALPLSSPALPSYRASSTPTRHTGSSNWLGGLLTAKNSLTSPIFPEEVVRKKETLKARLQFCSECKNWKHTTLPTSN